MPLFTVTTLSETEHGNPAGSFMQFDKPDGECVSATDQAKLGKTLPVFEQGLLEGLNADTWRDVGGFRYDRRD